MRKGSPYLIPLFLSTLSQRYLLRLAALSFITIWKDLRELLLVQGIFAPQQKKAKRQKKKRYNLQKKRYNLMIESLLSSNTSNRFKFIVTPTCGKNLWSPSQKWNCDSQLQENQGLQTTCSCNLYQVSLNSGQSDKSDKTSLTMIRNTTALLKLII